MGRSPIRLALLTAWLIALTLRAELVRIGPDSKLYVGVGENLVRSGRFVDVVRHDELLPSVGHPLWLGLLEPVLGSYSAVTRLSIFLAFAGIAYAAHRATGSFVVAVITTGVFSLGANELFITAGVEPSLAAVFAWLGAALVAGHQRRWTPRAVAVASGACLATILIRPLLAPLVALLVVAMVWLLWTRRRRYAMAVAIVPAVMLLTAAISFSVEGDSRMITGTYGSIPLYSGLNPHIDLERNYNSELWDVLPKDERKSALAVFDNVDGWQQRESLLRRMSLSFVQDHPGDAFDAVWFRVGRYTLNSELQSVRLLTWTLILAAVIAIPAALRGRLPSTVLVVFGAVVYLILTQSMFVYVGRRYALTGFAFSLAVVPFLLRTAAESSWPVVQESARRLRRRPGGRIVPRRPRRFTTPGSTEPSRRP